MRSLPLFHTALALWLPILVGSFVVPAQAEDGPASGWVAKPDAVTPELKRLSAILEEVRKGLARHGITKVDFGGGGARMLFDHIYFGKPLEMRDVDLIAVSDRPATAELCHTLGVAIQNDLVGKFSAPDVRPRPRANPALPVPQRYAYNAGYGFFWRNASEIIDLSIYHTDADRELNGIFDVDTIRIPLRPGATLADDIGTIYREHAYPDLVKKGFVVDEFGGYPNWRRKQIRMVRPENVAGEPVEQAIRVLRSYAKVGQTKFPPDIEAWLKSMIPGAKVTSRGQVARNITKVLEDRGAASELKALQLVGTIAHWSPALDAFLARVSESELEGLLKSATPVEGGKAPAAANGRLRALFGRLAPVDRLQVMQDLSKVESVLMSKWRSEALVELFDREARIEVPQAVIARVLENTDVKVPFATEVERITRSATLGRTEKRALYYRAVLRRVPADQRIGFIRNQKAMFAGLDLAEIRDLLRQSAMERTGFFTGVFNPVHYGHMDTARGAIGEEVLDRLVVMPTPATTHNEIPIAWEHRRRIAELSFADVPEVEVVPLDYKATLEINTGAAIQRLSDSLPKGATLVHLMGADSLERALNAGHSARFLKAANRKVLVAYRPPYGMPAIPTELDGRIVAFDPMSKVQQFTEENRSSTVIRTRRSRGESILGLAHPDVVAYIEKHGLYLPEVGPVCAPLMAPETL